MASKEAIPAGELPGSGPCVLLGECGGSASANTSTGCGADGGVQAPASPASGGMMLLALVSDIEIF